ncbi:unnamed protein product [Effrenium voratum]|uniref:Uncharacterized protein n=1 Tax=Effrenium voratum TaxID=2562239 RepID=A0AA36JK67_9DINO|nr:unnamed protein product [Effrenium voratum]CAJ1461452.1 unnamed protein product [Effrenium voratum]
MRRSCSDPALKAPVPARRAEVRRLLVVPPQRSAAQLISEPLQSQSHDPKVANQAKSQLLLAAQVRKAQSSAKLPPGQYWWNQVERKVTVWR